MSKLVIDTDAAAEEVGREYRDKLARWMVEMDLTLGGADTFDDLLEVLGVQITDLRELLSLRRKPVEPPPVSDGINCCLVCGGNHGDLPCPDLKVTAEGGT